MTTQQRKLSRTYGVKKEILFYESQLQKIEKIMNKYTISSAASVRKMVDDYKENINKPYYIEKGEV
ncbi:MAG: hypothetical protein GY756_09895 [bacterium]|nr:hypothetical protein [bacterium]